MHFREDLDPCERSLRSGPPRALGGPGPKLENEAQKIFSNMPFRNWNMFWKSQPEYKFYCKCHDKQFHFSNPQDDVIEKIEQVVITMPFRSA